MLMQINSMLRRAQHSASVVNTGVDVQMLCVRVAIMVVWNSALPPPRHPPAPPLSVSAAPAASRLSTLALSLMDLDLLLPGFPVIWGLAALHLIDPPTERLGYVGADLAAKCARHSPLQ